MATKKLPKSARTGKIVKASELKKKPNETYLQTVPVKKKKSGK